MLLNPIYKLLIEVVLIILFCVASYYEGYAHEHDKLVAFKATVTQEAADQSLISKSKESIQHEITTKSSNTYDNNLDQLDHALSKPNRVRPTDAGTDSMPTVATSSSRVDDPKSESLNINEDPEFNSNALKDALKLSSLQQWIKDEGLAQ